MNPYYWFLLISEAIQALGAGASHEALRKAIRAQKIAASDEAMRRELGGK